LIAGRVSLAVEYDLRKPDVRALQSLELAFFDEQQTGSSCRARRSDLQAVRFFLGYGLIFILQSLVTILVAAAVMLALNVELALLALLPAPLILARGVPVRRLHLRSPAIRSCTTGSRAGWRRPYRNATARITARRRASSASSTFSASITAAATRIVTSDWRMKISP